MNHQVCECRSEADRILELVELLPEGVSHAGGEVHQQHARDIRFGFKFLDEVSICFGVDEPVDIFGIVPLGISAMFAEFDTETMKRTGVKPLQKPSTMKRARRSRRETLRITSGFKYCSAELGMTVFRYGSVSAVDHGFLSGLGSQAIRSIS